MKIIDKSNLVDTIKSGVAVLDFWAAWCGPCKMLMPVMEEVQSEIGGRAIFGKVNVDDNPAIADEYKVSVIPSVFILKDGKIVDKFVGLKKKEYIVSIIEKAFID